jgi:acetyltransferase-like isoleucine patch superfamily enzyme
MDRYMARGRLSIRIRSILFLLPAWFAPHKSLRVLFHRLRGVRVGRDVEIGYFCLIGNVHPHMIHIDDHAVVAARSTILEHDNAYCYSQGGTVRFGEVHVRPYAFIGIGSVILPGVTIGEHAIVGAISVVSRNVPAWAVAAGAPARVVRRREGETEKPGNCLRCQ